MPVGSRFPACDVAGAASMPSTRPAQIIALRSVSRRFDMCRLLARLRQSEALERLPSHVRIGRLVTAALLDARRYFDTCAALAVGAAVATRARGRSTAAVELRPLHEGAFGAEEMIGDGQAVRRGRRAACVRHDEIGGTVGTDPREPARWVGPPPRV